MTDKPLIRAFASGANRDLDENKLDFEGFLSPVVMLKFAQYMHRKRKLADGTLRDSDNWQKGMPLDVYMKSLWRHFHDLWLHHRGLGHLAVENLDDTLTGLLFNVQGYAHETFKAEGKAPVVTAPSEEARTSVGSFVVECVDASGSTSVLVEGARYTVTAVNEDFYYQLAGVRDGSYGLGWFASRFRVVAP